MPTSLSPYTRDRPVIAVTGLYMLAAIVAAVVTGNTEFLFYVAVMLVLLAIVWGVHLKFGLSGAALWALSIWGALHMAGGLVPVPEGWPINGDIRVLYSLWFIPGYLKYDHVVHAYGFGVTTWVCWELLAKALTTRGADARPTFGLIVLCAAAGLGFGALNEVVEFFATLLVPKTNVGGYVNTGWDLVSNAVGATAAACVIWLCGRNRREKHKEARKTGE